MPDHYLSTTCLFPPSPQNISVLSSSPIITFDHQNVSLRLWRFSLKPLCLCFWSTSNAAETRRAPWGKRGTYRRAAVSKRVIVHEHRAAVVLLQSFLHGAGVGKETLTDTRYHYQNYDNFPFMMVEGVANKNVCACTCGWEIQWLSICWAITDLALDQLKGENKERCHWCPNCRNNQSHIFYKTWLIQSN